MRNHRPNAFRELMYRFSWLVNPAFWEDADDTILFEMPQRRSKPSRILAISRDRNNLRMLPNESERWFHKLFSHQPPDFESTTRLNKQRVNGALMFTHDNQLARMNTLRNNFSSIRLHPMHHADIYLIAHP